MEVDAPRSHAIDAVITHITTTDVSKLPSNESVTVELATLPHEAVQLAKRQSAIRNLVVFVSAVAVIASVKAKRSS